MSRHSFMLKRYAEQQIRKRKEDILHKARREVAVNANGTCGYVVKAGSNMGKYLGHNSIKHPNS